MLKLHKIIHSLSALTLILFCAVYLLPNKHLFAAVMLIVGSLFDVIEVFTLKPSSPWYPKLKDPHQLAAWTMSLSFLVFGMLIAQAAYMPTILVHSMWLVFVLLVVLAIKNKFKSFWINQTIFCNYLSIIVTVAIIKL